jgi:iron complex transport system ATP-binding protein
VNDTPLLLRTEALSVSVGARSLLSALSITVARGEFIAVLGLNGCGKSLTLLTLAGLRPADGGRIWLTEQPLAGLSRRAIARQVGLLPQDREESLPLTAMEAALLARHPHHRSWALESAQDREIARAALARLGVLDAAERLLNTLSGGEQRRAAMAALLAQQPQLYLLDEPTNHLDPHHQVEVLGLFRDLCASGAAVIATLHDPSLAERYADRVLLMYGDGRWRLGPTRDVLNAADLSELYREPLCQAEIPRGRISDPSRN